MLEGGVEGTVKHFPGLGRIRNNTDFSSTGITDHVATKDDPFLQPFADGIKAGAGLVMMASARYPKLDDDNPAMFSEKIVTGLLREQMGYDGSSSPTTSTRRRWMPCPRATGPSGTSRPG